MTKLKGTFEQPPGLVYKADFITTPEGEQQLEFIKSLDFHPVVMHGQAAKRTVRHFGLGYDFETRKTTPGEPIPAELLELRRRAEELAQIEEGSIIEALITRYPVGSTIGWHRDAGAFGIVIGISLLSPCVMRFQHGKGEQRHVYERILNPRSVYILQGEARSLWEHHIPATQQERYSITFRTLR